MKAISPAADSRGLLSFRAVNVRLTSRRIVIPDLVAGSMPYLGSVAEAADVVLVGEVLSADSEVNDRVHKPREYAEAGIPWYLMAEPEMVDYRSVTLRLYQLDGPGYAEHAVAPPGQLLKSEVPFPFAMDTNDLVHS
jgi:Uma2 family endonuclease